MSHTISYEGLEGDEKRIKAIEDIKFWLGDAFVRVHASAVNEYATKPFTLEEFRFNAAFVGVQGYPVEAWYEKIVQDNKKLNG